MLPRAVEIHHEPAVDDERIQPLLGCQPLVRGQQTAFRVGGELGLHAQILTDANRRGTCAVRGTACELAPATVQ